MNGEALTKCSAQAPDADLFDLALWPIAFVRFPELDEPRRSQRVLDGLSSLLARGERFVVVWIPPSHGHESEPHEDERHAALWIKQNKAALGWLCAGYLYITDDPGLRQKLTRNLSKMDKIFPFTKAILGDRNKALERARQLLEPDA